MLFWICVKLVSLLVTLQITATLSTTCSKVCAIALFIYSLRSYRIIGTF